VKRREFILAIGSAAAWPLAARAQRLDRVRRIGLLMAWAQSDPEVQPRMAAFITTLRELGWIDGRNCRIELRWSAGDLGLMQRHAKELIESTPDVIMAMTNPMVEVVHNLTRTIPIVFIQVAAPVESGWVASMAHPGGNMTGFVNFEPSMGGKWVELLKEVAPGVIRILVLMHPVTPHIAFWGAAQSAAASFGVQVTASQARDRDEVEDAIATFARQADGGLIVFPHPTATTNRHLIVELAERHRLPAIYPLRFFPAIGGLLSYGLDQVEQWRPAARYVDRILRGEKPADLPVQAPDKFELVINLKTAKALGLNVPLFLQQRADEVIE
jgi:putative tryptophan/tyrosine transport system substrate-binding protein